MRTFLCPMDSENPRKTLSESEARLKAASFCAYQERTQQEVRDKLYEYGLHRNSVEEVLSWLITENYINEERFAKAFAGGKFRIKKWGRVRILRELKQKGLSDYCIKKGMAEIEEEQYQQHLREWLEKKDAELKEKDLFIRKRKLAQFAIYKGYEPEEVWAILNTLL